MAQSNWVSDDNEDEDINIINFSTTLMFDLEEDQATAMQDFAFCIGGLFFGRRRSIRGIQPQSIQLE